MKKNDTAVIMLTYMRMSTFNIMADVLNHQTNKSFDLFISNSGPYHTELTDLANKKITNINYNFISSDNDNRVWRRHILARDLAKSGYKKIMFLDDDIIIPKNYIESALNQYEDHSYKSWWAWDLQGGNNYEKDRIRILDKNTSANYCGGGVSIIDARVFLEDKYFDNLDPERFYMEDIWLSMYTKHIMGWKLRYLDIPNISFSNEAADTHALYINVKDKSSGVKNKDEYVRYLKDKYGWLK